ncbi:MAG: helix-turn-helix domain-containing protein [Alphaproteobacteria bacterium]|nr:helix-turn-helix domain-containing protein [Alphaproteobacteria bacterium]
MAQHPPDAKSRALKQHGCLNPHAKDVTDELFLSNAFFDPRDLLQVKYEMLRRVREDGVPVSRAAATFGVSRPTWYQAQRAYDAGGLPALLPHRPGPRRAHKLTEEVVDALRAAKAEQPALTARELVELVRERFGISVHRRSIDRALARGGKLS